LPIHRQPHPNYPTQRMQQLLRQRRICFRENVKRSSWPLDRVSRSAPPSREDAGSTFVGLAGRTGKQFFHRISLQQKHNARHGFEAAGGLPQR
jgi:hypothetical protein